MRRWFREYGLIKAMMGLCLVLFIVQNLSPLRLEPEHGAVPARLSDALQSLLAGEMGVETLRAAATLFTSVFLHGDVTHLVGNMLFFWVFGCVAWDILGRAWMFFLFLVCGAAGMVVQSALNPASLVPIIGASGAISGLGGVYFGLVLTWSLPDPDVWPLARPVPPVQLAAFAVIGFALDVVSMGGIGQGVAYGAHVGGFMSGMLTAAILTALYASQDHFRVGRRR